MSITCRHCGLEHSEHERCWDAAQHHMAALHEENEALRDAINALNDAVEGKRFDDASVAELLNGAMRIPRANNQAQFREERA